MNRAWFNTSGEH